jgi:hypothetical protein
VARAQNQQHSLINNTNTTQHNTTQYTTQHAAPLFTGAQGDALERAALDRTLALRPKQRWVPWVVVNDVPLFDDFENLQTFVCAAYAGPK